MITNKLSYHKRVINLKSVSIKKNTIAIFLSPLLTNINKELKSG